MRHIDVRSVGGEGYRADAESDDVRSLIVFGGERDVLRDFATQFSSYRTRVCLYVGTGWTFATRLGGITQVLQKGEELRDTVVDGSTKICRGQSNHERIGRR